MPEPNPLQSAAVFMVSVVAMSFLFAWARLSTGGIWPAGRGGAEAGRHADVME